MVRLVRGSASPIGNSAELLTSFHHAHETPKPVYFLTMRIAELPKTTSQLFWRVALKLDMFLNFFEKRVQLCVEIYVR